MKVNTFFKQMLFMFSTIVTVQVIFMTLISTIRQTTDSIHHRDLQTVMITAVAGILPSFIFLVVGKISRKTYFLLLLPLHFTLSLTLVLATLFLRNQIATFAEITYPLLLFFILYAGFYIKAELQYKKALEELNKRIHATHQD